MKVGTSNHDVSVTNFVSLTENILPGLKMALDKMGGVVDT